MTEYKNPVPTVDVIMRMDANPRRVILIKRLNPPIAWALPGGFVNEGESLTHAAAREAEEETALKVQLLIQLGTYSQPNRDPRQHTISTVFVGNVFEEPVAGDDAGEVVVVDIGTALSMDLAFDHHQILSDYLTYITHGNRPALP